MKASLLLIATILILAAPLLADSVDVNTSDSLKTEDSTIVSGTTSEHADNDYTYPMSEERKEKLISYSRFNNIWRFASFFIGIALLLIVLFTGLSGKFQKWAESITGRKSFVYFFYILFFTLFMFVVNLPIDYYRGFIVEHDYGFSNQTGGEWFGETLKSLGLQLFFSLIIFGFMYWLINKTKKWWLYFALGAIPFLVLIMIIYPVVISPIFNEFKPLQDQTLATEMTALAEGVGIHNPDIYEVDGSKQSNKINAYFVGMFGTKRIVMYDTIIKNFTIDELKFVMAHEMGHYMMNHIWIGLFGAIIMIFITLWLVNKLLHKVIDRYKNRFGFSSLGSIASLPLILLFMSVFSFITQPAQNGISRIMEYQADRYGMEHSGVTDEVAVTAFDKLSVYNLSDPAPADIIEFWFYDHPALIKRMAKVREIYREIN